MFLKERFGEFKSFKSEFLYKLHQYLFNSNFGNKIAFIQFHVRFVKINNIILIMECIKTAPNNV